MSDDPNTPQTPPITRRPGVDPAAPATAGGPAVAHAGVSRAALIWIGVAVVVLSFVASFLGASLARSTDASEPAATATPEPTTSQMTPADYEAAIEEILPAGSAVRAGTGVPEAGKGYEGDVFIDISTSDVYLFQDGAWVEVGNIRQSAAENLTGETGAAGAAGADGSAGEAGADGSAGEAGADGTSGTQLSLGVGAPEADTCETDGDIYIDTEELAFYECTSGEWTLFGPTDSSKPAPESTESGSNG